MADSGTDARQPATGHAERGGRSRFSADRIGRLPRRAGVSSRQRHHSRRHQAEQHAGRRPRPGKAGRFRTGPTRQQRGRESAQGDDQVHGPRVGLRPVRRGRPSQRPLFTGVLGLRVDVRVEIRDFISGSEQFRARSADRLDDVARRRGPQSAADRPRTRRRAAGPYPSDRTPGGQGPIEAMQVG